MKPEFGQQTIERRKAKVSRPYPKARRLVESIGEVAGKRAREKITQELTEPTEGSSAKLKARWTREVTARMDEMLDEEQCREILERCSCPISRKRSAEHKRMWRKTQNLDD